MFDPGHDLGTALDHGQDELGKCLLVDQAAQRFDQRHCDRFVRVRKGCNDRQDGVFAPILELGDQFLGSRT
jgi:hypothetical protein